MIANILPRDVVAVEAFDDSVPASLFPIEQEQVARAVDKRRREYSTARRCAREALAQLGYEPAPLPTGERGAPVWPPGAVGSITHCLGYRAAVVAPAARVASVGVDAEPNEPLPDGVLAAVAGPAERHAVGDLLRRDDSVRWDRLLFCAKESVYKAWFPLTSQWLDFHEVVVTFDPGSDRFDARLIGRTVVVRGEPRTGLPGRWMVGRGLALTAVTMG
jgi:4'-phosphopantetheinyl transferase EntD